MSVFVNRRDTMTAPSPNFVINATELKMLLGSTGTSSYVIPVHRIFEAIWKRYSPQQFQALALVPAATKQVAPATTALVTVTARKPWAGSRAHGTGGFSQLANRCVVQRWSRMNIAIAESALYNQVCELYNQRGNRARASELAKRNGISFERHVLAWFESVMLPCITNSRDNLIRSQYEITRGTGPVQHLAKQSFEGDMRYRFMGFVDRNASVGWWLRGKVDGLIIPAHHRLLKNPKQTGVVEIKVREHESSHNYERDGELLQLLAYLKLLGTQTGYIVPCTAVPRPQGILDIRLDMTEVTSDAMIWDRWIIPRLQAILYSIHWLTIHSYAGKAYFRLSDEERIAYVDRLLHRANESVTTFLPPVCKIR